MHRLVTQRTHLHLVTIAQGAIGSELAALFWQRSAFCWRDSTCMAVTGKRREQCCANCLHRPLLYLRFVRVQHDIY